jgi:hypothetical protein
VAEELLDRAQRLPADREPGREGMAQVVELDRAHPHRDAGGLEALGDLAPIERVAGLRVG